MHEQLSSAPDSPYVINLWSVDPIFTTKGPSESNVIDPESEGLHSLWCSIMSLIVCSVN